MRTMPDFFIGIDSGTQGTKTIIIDNQGNTVGKASANYGLIKGLPPGHMEQHPETWREAMINTIRNALKNSQINSSQVRGIGVSGQQHGLVPLDIHGNVVRPAKLWNDTSTAQECVELTEALGGVDETIRLLGNSILPGYTAGKILWLLKNEPENYEKMATVLLPHDYLNYILTGNRTMEFGDASGTALMDIRTRKWHEKAVDTVDPSLWEKLPDVQPSDKPAGTIRNSVAEMLGLSPDVLVSSGGGDNMMGAIGTGNTSQGKVTVSLGTSGTIYAFSDHPIVDPKGEVAAFCDSTNSWLPLVCTMNVTVATELARKMYGLDFELMEREIDATPVGSEGLLLLPYITGERTPNVPNGSGVLYGLTSKTFKRGYLLRSTMEGVTLGLNYGLNRLRELGINPDEIRLTGGGSKNRVWRQIAADIFNAEIVVLKEGEGAAYGAAVQSMWTYLRSEGENVSINSITDELVKVDEESRVTPTPSSAQQYRKLQKLQDKLSLSLRAVFDKA
jgi:xylulokinase